MRIFEFYKEKDEGGSIFLFIFAKRIDIAITEANQHLAECNYPERVNENDLIIDSNIAEITHNGPIVLELIEKVL